MRGKLRRTDEVRSEMRSAKCEVPMHAVVCMSRDLLRVLRYARALAGTGSAA